MRVDYFLLHKNFDANYTVIADGIPDRKTSIVSSWIADDGIYNNVNSDQVNLCIGNKKNKAYKGKAFMRHVGKTKANPITLVCAWIILPMEPIPFSAWAKYWGVSA